MDVRAERRAQDAEPTGSSGFGRARPFRRDRYVEVALSRRRRAEPQLGVYVQLPKGQCGPR